MSIIITGLGIIITTINVFCLIRYEKFRKEDNKLFEEWKKIVGI